MNDIFYTNVLRNSREKSVQGMKALLVYSTMHIIGLTGGIATGKSSVAAMLADLGAKVIDADQLSRDAVIPGSQTLEQIADLFGRQILLPDGSLNRQLLRSLVFSDPAKRMHLEKILHPAIKTLALERIEEFKLSDTQVVVYMAPLLIESGATDRVDEIWVVTVQEEVQLERLMARDHCSLDEALNIIAAQMPLTEKKRYGLVIIDNSGSLEVTRQQVLAAWQQRTGL